MNKESDSKLRSLLKGLFDAWSQDLCMPENCQDGMFDTFHHEYKSENYCLYVIDGDGYLYAKSQKTTFNLSRATTNKFIEVYKKAKEIKRSIIDLKDVEL